MYVFPQLPGLLLQSSSFCGLLVKVRKSYDILLAFSLLFAFLSTQLLGKKRCINYRDPSPSYRIHIFIYQYDFRWAPLISTGHTIQSCFGLQFGPKGQTRHPLGNSSQLQVSMDFLFCPFKRHFTANPQVSKSYSSLP